MPTPNPPRPTPLTEIANAMYAQLATANGQRHHPLSHGLNIVLQRHDNLWLLKLGRQKVYPSELETLLCKRAFRLADDAAETRHAPTAAGWHVTAIDWTGAAPLARPLPQPKPRRGRP